MERGISGWENVARDPGWAGIVISSAASHRDWAGRSLAELADELGAGPRGRRVRCPRRRPARRLVVIECMSEPDVETIMAVPWIAVCTDAEGRRPGHPILDAGKPHPRTYGSTARVLGAYARERGVAFARGGRRQADRPSPPNEWGCAIAGSFAKEHSPTSSCSIPRPSPTRRPTREPARHPIGIEHVIVNGRAAILDGVETGDRPGGCCGAPDAARGAAPPIVNVTETAAIAPCPAARSPTRCDAHHGRAACAS